MILAIAITVVITLAIQMGYQGTRNDPSYYCHRGYYCSYFLSHSYQRQVISTMSTGITISNPIYAVYLN